MLVPNTNTRARCTGDDESAPKSRDSTRRRCTARSRSAHRSRMAPLLARQEERERDRLLAGHGRTRSRVETTTSRRALARLRAAKPCLYACVYWPSLQKINYGGASRTPVAEGGGALWKARRSISPREKSGEKSSVGSAPRGVSALGSRAAGRNSGRTRAISPGACRGSLWFARIPTLAA